MALTITSQRPASLDPVYSAPSVGDFDPVASLRTAVIEPLLDPLHPNVSVMVADDQGTDVTDQVETNLLACLGDQVNPDAEDFTRDLLGQSLINYDANTPLPVTEVFAAQAGHRHKMPAPVPGRVVYSAPTDIIPAAKTLLAGRSDGDEFFASVAYTFHPDTLGIWFMTSAAFDDFKVWLDQQVQLMNAVLPSDTVKLLADFDNLTLTGRLTESLLLRKDMGSANEELSFPRVLVQMLMSYMSVGSGPNAETGVMPFNLDQLFCPTSVVLVNVEAHARASGPKVTREWELVNRALASPIKVINRRALTKLTALPRAASKAVAQAMRVQPGAPGNRAANVAFRSASPKIPDLYKDILRVLRRMKKVNQSQNVYRSIRTSFLRANRRDPHNFNLPGKTTSVSYLPDIHLYIDTSGSISERNYQDVVQMLITLAKKLGVNMYFNTFSHMLSTETMLKIEGRSAKAIWQDFRRIPKVTGGTDYLQIWKYINASPRKRRQRMSIIVTDFEWWPPSTREDQPPNLFYAPCSAMDWDQLVRSAEDFAKGMRHIDPSVRQKMLGMIA